MRHLGIWLLAWLLPSPGALAVPSWQDLSPHNTQFVTAQEGVRLEVLDWGGSGRPLVLLAGSGNTAHVFDGFAPKLSRFCHVIKRYEKSLSAIPGARIVELPGANHYIFLSNEAEVIRDIRRFIASLH